MPPFRTPAVLLAACLASCPLPAAPFTWTGLASDDDPLSAANWLGNLAPPSDGTAHLHFAGNVRLTPNFSSAFNAFALTFDEGGGAFTLGGSNITLQGGGIRQYSSTAQTINNSLFLAAAQTWSFAPSASLTLGGAVSAANSNVLVNLQGSSLLTVNGNYTEAPGSALFKNGSGTLVLGGSNSLLGGLLIQAGVVRAQSNGALTGGTVSVSSQAELQLAAGYSAATSTALSLSANSTVHSLGAASFAGPLLLGGNGVNLVSDAGLLNFTSASAVSGSGSLNLGGAGDGRIAANVGFAVVMNGTGQWTLPGTLSTTQTVNAGTLVLSGSGGSPVVNGGTALVSGSVVGGTVNAGGTLTFQGATTGTTTGAGGVTVNTGGVVSVDNSLGIVANRLGSGALTLGGGTYQLISASGNNSDAVGTLALTAGASTIRLFNNAGGFTRLAATTLTRASGATLLLAASGLAAAPGAGSSNFVVTTLGTGAAAVGGGGAAGSQTISILPYAVAIDPVGLGTFFVAPNIPTANGMRSLSSGESATTIADGSTTFNNINLSSNLTLATGGGVNALQITSGAVLGGAGSLTLNSGLLLSNFAATTINLAGLSAASGAELIAHNYGALTINSIIGGNGGLTKTGPATLTLAGANTYSGGTRINQGTVVLAGSGTLGAAANTLTLNGGALDLGGTTQSIGALSIAAGGTAIYHGTLAGTTFAIANPSGEVEIEAVLAGTTLTKTGAGTLTLSGLNTYTGTTTVSGGVLSVSSLTNRGAPGPLGAGTTVALNSATLALTGGTVSTDRFFTYAGNGTIDVASGASLTLTGGQTNNGVLVKAGAGTLTLAPTAVSFSSFFPTAVVNAGTLVLAAADVPGLRAMNGGLTLNGGTLQLAGLGNDQIGDNFSVTMGGGTFDLNGRSETINNLSGGSGLVTNTRAGSTAVLTLAGSSGTFNGFIADGAGQVAITKIGSATTFTLAGVHTYTGATTLQGGVFSVALLGDGGAPSTLGASSNAAANLVLDGGTLTYTGAVVGETDRLFTLGLAGGTLSNTSSTGALSFTNAGNIAFTGGAGARTLTLSTNTTGLNNTFAPALGDGGGPTTLVRSGGGTWILTGANTYSGGTIVNSSSTLRLSGAGTLGASTSPVSISGSGVLDLGTTNQTVGVFTGASGTLQGTGTLTASSYVFGDGTFNLNAPIGGNAGTTLLKTGTGTLTIGANSPFAGSAVIAGGGTVAMGGGFGLPNAALLVQNGTLTTSAGTTATATRAASLSLNNAVIALAGASTVSSSDVITGALNLQAGASTITLTPGASRNLTLSAGSLTRDLGGTVLIRGPLLGAQAAGTGSNSTNFLFGTTPTSLLAGGGGAAGTPTISILPFALGDLSTSGNGTDFLTYGTNGLRLLGAGETSTTLAAGTVTSQNIRLTASTSVGSATTINSLNIAGAFTLSGAGPLTISSGALLALGNATVSVSSLALAAEGFLHVPSGFTLTISSALAGSGSLVKTGAGTLTLSTSQTHDRAIIVRGGILSVNSIADGGLPSALGQSSSAASNLVLGNGTTLRYTGVAASTDRNFTVDTAVTFDVNNANLTLTGANSGTAVLTKTGSQTLTLAGAADNTGLSAIHAGGTLVLGKASSASVHALRALTVNAGTVRLAGTGGDQIEDSSLVTINAGTFDLNGRSETIGGLAGTGGTVTSTVAGNATLQIGANSGIFSGVIGNGSGVVSLGLTGGALTLTAVQTYTGATTLQSGSRLLLSGAATVAGSAVTVASGATLAFASNTATPTTRTASVTLAGGTIEITGSTFNTSDSLGSLTLPANSGLSSLTLTPALGHNSVLNTGTFTRNPGTFLVLRGGSGLGITAPGTSTTSTNVLFGSAPTLVNGIVPFAFSDAGSGVSTGLVGYSATNGFTVPAASSFLTGVPTGVSTSNVRLSAAQSLTVDSTINALVLDANGQIVTGDLGTTLTLSSGIVLATGNSAIGSSSASILAFAGSEGVFNVNPGATLSVNSSISGAADLSKIGTGTLTLSGSNSAWTGGLRLLGGTVNLGSASALGTGTLTLGGATLDNTSGGALALSANNAQAWVGDFTFAGSAALNVGSGAVTLGGNRTVTVAASTLTVGGAIGDGGNAYGLTKAGPGTLVLSGTSTYGGSTTVGEGTLSLTGGALASPLLTVNSGATFAYSGGTLAGRLVLSGDLVLNASLTAGNGLQNNTTLNLGSGRTLTLNGAGLDNQGTIALSGNATLTGTTLTNAAGALLLGNGTIGGTLVNNGNLFVGSGQTLNLTNASTNAGIVQLAGANAVLNGGTITNSGFLLGRGTVNNAITNQSTIQPSGGTLTLNGTVTNPVGGQFVVGPASSLVFGGAGLAANAGLISLSGGTFSNGANPLVNDGTISGYGTLTTGGTGLLNNASLILGGAGTNTLNGPVTNAASGTITVANTPATFNGNVVNDGRFVTVATNVVFNGSFTNNGIFHSDPSLNTFGHLTVGPGGSLFGDAGDAFLIRGDLFNQSRQRTLFDLSAARLTLAGLTPSTAHLLAWSGTDRGAIPGGFVGNFAVGRFELALGDTLSLADGDLSTPGAALYVHALILSGGTAQIEQISGNGFNIYYDVLNPENAYLGGQTFALAGGGFIQPAVPEPATWALLLAGAAAWALRRRPRH